MTKLKLGIISAVVVAGVATPLVIQHQAETKLRENEMLQQQNGQMARLTAENERLSRLFVQAKSPPMPSLPAPPMRTPTSPTGLPTEELESTNLMIRLLKGETPKLTPRADRILPRRESAQRSQPSRDISRHRRFGAAEGGVGKVSQ